MLSEEQEKIVVDFKKFKGHHRKFPRALVIRIIVALISIAIIFFLVQFLDERMKAESVKEPEFQIEIEY
jgi:hypothetical protein